MQWDDNVLEEDNVFISEWDGESTDNTRQNVEELSGTIEFMVFMDKSEETLVNCLSDHFSSWHKFGVQFMKYILKIVPLDRLFRIEKLQELLHELWGNIYLKRSDLNCLVDYELKEELVDTLKVWPCWVNLILLLNSCLWEL